MTTKTLVDWWEWWAARPPRSVITYRRLPSNEAAMTTRNEALCEDIEKRLDEFEAMVEDEEGREGYHVPTEMERYYIDSFVAELVGDRDFLRLCIQARMETEEYHLAQGGCPECGKVDTDGEAHWGRNCDGQRLLDFLPK